MNKLILKNLFFISLFITANYFASGRSISKKNIDSDLREKAKQWFQNKPVKFIENKGQLADMNGNPVPFVLFSASGPGVGMYITEKGLTYVFIEAEEDDDAYETEGLNPKKESKTKKWERIDMNLAGADIKKENILKESPSTVDYNYFYTHCPKGINGVKQFEKIIITDIYPGIDWILYNSNEKGFKYDFIVNPGADPNLIKLVYSSKKKLRLNEVGNIFIQTENGKLTEQAPETFQNGQQISSRFISLSTMPSIKDKSGYDATIGFEIENYDTTQALTIDPQLMWSTFFGTSGYEGFRSADCDASGNLFLTGYTSSFNGYPVLNPGGAYFQGTTGGGSNDATVLKFTNAGVPVWITYFGGTGADEGASIHTDLAGNVFVTGHAGAGLPVTSGAYQTAFGGGLAIGFNTDAFILKFTNAGALVFSTYYGGTKDELGNSICVDPFGNFFITGMTSSTNFPLLSLGGAYNQGAFGGAVLPWTGDAFILKFNNAGVRLWATYYGGAGDDYGNAICTDQLGNVYITGSTTSNNFPLMDPAGGADYFQGGYGGGTLGSTGDGFILRLTNSGAQTWSTYYGGSGDDAGTSICTDLLGNLFVTGFSTSANLFTLNPLGGAYFQTFTGGFAADAFIVKFNNLNVAQWATYYGGTSAEGQANHDTNDNMIVDKCNNVYLSFTTSSTDEPLLQGCSSEYYDGTFNGSQDIVIIKFNNSGVRLSATYYGGSGSDYREVVAIDNSDNLFICGEWNLGPFGAGSATYPLVNPGGSAFFDATFNGGGEDCYIAKFSPPPPTQVQSNPSGCFCNGSATANMTCGTAPYSYIWSNGIQSLNTTNLSSMITGLCGGTYTVQISDASCFKDTLYYILSAGVAGFTLGSSQNNVTCNASCNGTATVTPTGGTAPYTFFWSNSKTTQSVTGLCAGTYTVVVTDNANCTNTFTITITQPSLLTNTITAHTNVSCNGGNNGTATTAGSGGTTTYSYLWNNGQNNTTATGLIAGTYTITITDANGCTARTTATITQPTVLTAAITASTSVSCNPANAGGTGSGNNGSATVAGNGGTLPYSYLWNNGQNNASSTGLVAGSYTVTVTDANGCTARTFATITQPSALTLTLSSTNSTCGNANGSVSSIVLGGTSSYSYKWSSTVITSGLSNIAAGIYSLTVTDANGCSIAGAVTVNNSGSPTVTATPVNVLCFGDNNGMVSSTVSGGGMPYSYHWSNGSSLAAASGLIAGIYSLTVTDVNGCTALAWVLISEPIVLSANAGVIDNVSCFGGNNGAAIANSLGGTSPYSYNWSNGTTGFAASNLQRGSYTVTVIDNNGCIKSATVSITEPPDLVINVVSNHASCNGGASGASSILVVGGTPSYNYLWDMGATTAIVSGLSAGTYSFVITDNNGCSETSGIDITEPLQLLTNTSVINHVSCFGGNNGGALVSAMGGTFPYRYEWNNNSTTDVLSNLISGSYTVTVTDDNGCSLTTGITITEPSLLQVSALTTNVSCKGGNNGSAIVNPSGGTILYSYLWSNSSSSQAILNIVAATYSVTVTDNNGCTVTTMVTVTEPALITLTITSSNVNCFGNNSGTAAIAASGGTGSYIYNWSNASASAAINNLAAGIYSVSVTDSNGCSQTASTTITQPAMLSASVTTSDVLCFGDNNGSAMVNTSGGTGAYAYNWSNGSSQFAVSNLQAGNYNVTVTDNNGCTATANGTVNQPVVLSFSLSSINSTCGNANGSAAATVSGGTFGYSYNWSNGSISASISFLMSSVYSLTVTDSNGCSIAASVLVNNSGAPTLTVTTTDALCFGTNTGSAAVNASGGTGTYNYSWSNGQTTSTISHLIASLYSVTVTDGNGCSEIANGSLNQPTLITATVTSSTNVSCNGGNNGTATALGSGGTPIYFYSWNNGQSNITATGLSAGTYTITITDVNGCNARTTITITEPAAVIIIPPSNNSMCIFDNLNLSASATGGTSPYTYNWNPGNISGNPVNFSPTITTTYTIIATDSKGCLSSPQLVTVTINPLPNVTFTPLNAAGCVPLCVDFSNTTPGTSSSAWNFGDGNFSTNNNELHCYTTAGVYSVSLEVTDVNGCSNRYSQINMVNAYPLPVAGFTATPPLTSLSDPLIIFTDNSIDAITWQWSFGDVVNSSSSHQNTQFTYSDSGSYAVQLIITNSHGCADTTEQTIIVHEAYSIYIPNTFTPDGDGLNDIFIPIIRGIEYDNYEFYIFDRWGNLIFETDDLHKGWDGRANGGKDIVQIDTYVWKLKTKDIEGKKHRYIGHVNVIK